ncbi:acetyl-CoA carboxylase biotin carboxyl carrier protein [Clostridium sp.]|uniref:acetyl-CoA carboxylase biotin carboxyl carrier protein n=1 Tax=Clostridium sp. TaxID=1506 RepID=UPI003F3D9BBB
MDLKEIKELVEMINSSDLAYFELKMDDNYLKMDKSLTRSSEANSKTNESGREVEEKETFVRETKIETTSKEELVIESTISKDEIATDIIDIKAPMVGTFYGSPSPDKDAFVKEGMKVSKGDILCIVEAMKLMNEIESDSDCEIVKILVKDGEMVEYGQSLFSVRRV